MSQRTFAATAREQHWTALSGEIHDVLVIGAGITGAGVSRDLAGRGLSVAMVDGGDIGGGTSSRSSRLIHGGLRYLETFDFALVFESLRERRRLFELAPHLVHPLPFVFPVFRGDPTGLPKLAAGMWLYETLSLFRSPRRHRLLQRQALLQEEPSLRADGLVGGAMYYDGQVDDARLTLAVARAAVEAGATLVSHARVVGFPPASDDGTNVLVRDSLSDRETIVRARLVVNATGPWSDLLRAVADPAARPRLRTTKGVHILVARDRVANRNAIIFRSPVDGRVMFVLPWGAFTYVGTTDTGFDGDPGDVRTEPGDVEYLLTSVNAIYPAARLTVEDVLSSWAGIRPLLAPASAAGLTESETSREHEIWRDPSGLVNIAGGKLTTYRSMAAETADFVARLLEQRFGVKSGPYYTEFLPLPGALEEGDRERAATRTRAVGRGLTPAATEHLIGRYAADAGAVLDLVEADPALAAPLVDGSPYLRAEVVHAVRSELALTLEDVMRRRLQLFYERADGGMAVAGEVAQLMSRYGALEWTGTRMDEELRDYAEKVRATRPWRAETAWSTGSER